MRAQHCPTCGEVLEKIEGNTHTAKYYCGACRKGWYKVYSRPNGKATYNWYDYHSCKRVAE